MAEGIIKNNNWVLLWKNASPTSQFVTQSIPIDYAPYVFFRIDFLNASNDTPVCQSIELRWLDGFVASSVVGGKIKTRYLNLGASTAGSVNIFGALVHNTYSPSAVNDDTQIIPYRIYGRKG